MAAGSRDRPAPELNSGKGTLDRDHGSIVRARTVSG